MNILGTILSVFSILAALYAFIAILYRFLKESGIIKIPANNACPKRQKSRDSSFVPPQKGILFKIIFLIATTRLFIYVLGYMGAMLFQNQATDFFSSFQNLWNRWDAPHYLSIAENWYLTSGDEKLFIVFYPFYPILIKGANMIINDYFLSGIFVSNLALITACYYLFRLVELDFGEDVPINSVKYFLIFPASFFLGAPFSESVFIALSVMTLYYTRKDKGLIAGICGLLAAFTRSLGVLLVVPVFIESIMSFNIIQNLKSRCYLKTARIFAKSLVPVFLIPLGTLSYLWVNKAVTGHWFTFLKYQKEHWQQSFGLFYENIRNFAVNAATWQPEVSASLWIPQLAAIVFALVLLIYGINKLRASYMAYFLVYLFISISPTWLLSGPRYIMALFPIYMLLAIISRNKYADILITFILGLSLCYCTLAFVTGHHIM